MVRSVIRSTEEGTTDHLELAVMVVSSSSVYNISKDDELPKFAVGVIMPVPVARRQKKLAFSINNYLRLSGRMRDRPDG